MSVLSFRSSCHCLVRQIAKSTHLQAPMSTMSTMSSRWVAARPPAHRWLSRSEASPLCYINVRRYAAPMAGAGGKKPTVQRQRRDEEITSKYVNYVDNEGQLHERQLLDRVLSSFDRSLYFLVEVNASAKPPVCRLFDKKHLFEKQKASKKKPKQVEHITKEVTFGWNVSEHDMGHKLNKAVQFLDKGNRVKIEIKHKKGQQRLDKVSQEEVIAQVKDYLQDFKLTKGPEIKGNICVFQFENQ